MYPASSAFHTAVANGSPQIAMLLFSDAVFTNSDIRVDSGLELNEYFNTEEDLCIGQTPSSELTFTLFNDGEWLNTYGFGEFTAAIGVLVYEAAWTLTGRLGVESAHHRWTVDRTGNTLRRDGTAVGTQPGRPIESILIRGDDVYCFGNNYAVVYSDSTGAMQQKSANMFMRHKGTALAGTCAFYNESTRLLRVYQGSNIQTYEFVPLGTFIADRPNVPTEIEIDLVCYDRMQKFEADMPDAAALGISYPTTAGTLLTRMCAYLGVPLKSADFLNSGLVIPEAPEEFERSTMRTVLGWIAEAACANARFDRDGKLVMDWTRATTQVIDEHVYSEFRPYWYETQAVSKVYNRDTESGEDLTQGTGEIGYLIQDNPLLRGVS